MINCITTFRIFWVVSLIVIRKLALEKTGLGQASIPGTGSTNGTG